MNEEEKKTVQPNGEWKGGDAEPTAGCVFFQPPESLAPVLSLLGVEPFNTYCSTYMYSFLNVASVLKHQNIKRMFEKKNKKTKSRFSRIETPK